MIDLRQLRETLALRSVASTDVSERRSIATVELERLAAAARLALAVLEGAEEIEWCTFHEAGGVPGLDCWGAGINGQDSCTSTTVLSLRIPLSALRDADPNEEPDRA